MASKQCRQFWQDSPALAQPHKQNDHNITDYNPVTNTNVNTNTNTNTKCSHQLKIAQLEQRVRLLQENQRILNTENDRIIRSIQGNADIDRKKQKQNQVWKIKYMKLRAQNDRKAAQFASILAPQILSARNTNTNRQSITSLNKLLSQHQKPQIQSQQPTRTRCTSMSTNTNLNINLQKSLTKQQQNYVRQLQQAKRNRSSSLKMLHSVDHNAIEGKRYCAKLPDGLLIHIIDSR